MSNFHVNGPASLTLAGSLCGWSEDGLEIVINQKHRDAMVDTMGSAVPGEVQCMLAEARISGDLVVFDWAVIEAALSRSQAGAAAGTMPGAGTLLGAGGWLQPLEIASSLDNFPWRFPSAYLADATSAKVGTVRTMVSVTFRALPFLPAGSASSAGAVLYTH